MSPANLCIYEAFTESTHLRKCMYSKMEKVEHVNAYATLGWAAIAVPDTIVLILNSY